MSSNKSNVELSRIEWVPNGVSSSGYPGDEKIKIGCLQRIADAAEKMAMDHDRLVKDRDYYKSLYESFRNKSHHLWRCDHEAQEGGSQVSTAESYHRVAGPINILSLCSGE